MMWQREIGDEFFLDETVCALFPNLRNWQKLALRVIPCLVLLVLGLNLVQRLKFSLYPI
jgi:hypothetical protein